MLALCLMNFLINYSFIELFWGTVLNYSLDFHYPILYPLTIYGYLNFNLNQFKYSKFSKTGYRAPAQYPHVAVAIT
jgi:hypothetical protein